MIPDPNSSTAINQTTQNLLQSTLPQYLPDPPSSLDLLQPLDKAAVNHPNLAVKRGEFYGLWPKWSR
jgi:hypothetical protein